VVIVGYVGEAMSNDYIPGTTLSGVLAAPTVPSGLSFVLNEGNGLLAGTPSVIAPATNYLLYGSNSATGYSVSTTVSIQICNARVLLASYPSTQRLTVGVPFDGVMLTNANSNALLFSGRLPNGLGYNTTSPSTSVTIAGTPTVPLSGTFSSLITVTDTVTKAVSTVTIPFVYNESVQYTYPTSPTTIQLYSNIPISTTYGSNIQLSAVTKYGTGTGMTYVETSALPPDIVLSPSGVISGSNSTIGQSTSSFTATNSTLTSAVSSPITFAVSQATFVYTIPTFPILHVGSNITPVTFSVTTPAYFDNGASEIAAIILTVPNGLTCKAVLNSFTISGTPKNAGTSAIIISINASNVTPQTLSIPLTIVPDSYAFTASPAGPYVFSQNIPITPIRVAVSFTYGQPPVLYLNSSLPAGLRISSSGLIEGTPSASTTASSTFTIQATNGYTTAIGTYAYTTSPDAIVIYCPGKTSFALYPFAPLSISLRTLLRSGGTLTYLVSGYLYGLNLTPTSLSGVFGSGVYPDVVIPSGNTIVPIIGVGTTSAGTLVSFVTTGAQTRTKVVSIGSNLYYSTSDSLSTLIPATGTPSYAAFTDFKQSGAGSNTYMAATNTEALFYTSNGGVSYSSFVGTLPVYQIAFQDNKWYGLGSSGFVLVPLKSSGTTIALAAGPAPRLSDGGFVMQRVPSVLTTFRVSDVVSTGTTIQFTLTDPTNYLTTGPTVGLWSFSGFSYSGYNVEQVRGSNIDSYTVVVASAVRAGSEHYEPSAVHPTALQYTVSNGRFLLGGATLRYIDFPSASSSYPATCSLEEIMDISTSVYTTLVAAGGHAPNDQPTSAYSTLQWSSDGQTWNTSTNDFTWYAKSVVWGGYINQTTGVNRTWIALGRNFNNLPGIKYSTDGKTWADVNIGVTFTSATVIGPVQFDGTNWQLFIGSTMYTHDANSSTLALSSFWKSSVSSAISLYPTPWFGQATSPSITLGVGVTTGGPVFISPTTFTFIGYQYVPITAIVFDTTATDASFFLASTLPAGLAWSPVTIVNERICATITGQPVILGTSIIDVYAQTSSGISKITVTVITRPLPLKTLHTTAAEYTNFMKEKVIADSAVSAINNEAYVSPVGTFLANDPQRVTRAPEICCIVSNVSR
jgi:hypothetical protein